MGIIDRITGRGRTPVQDTRSALERAQTTNDPGVVGGSLTKFVDTLLDAGIDGRGPFDPARQVADEALRANGGDAEKAIDAIVRKHITLAAGNGFLTSLGGFITMPVALPANVLGFYLVATRMTAAVAAIRGYDITNEQIRTAVLLSLVGADSSDLLKKAGVVAPAGRLTNLAAQRLPGPALMMVNKAVGFRLLSRTGTGVLKRFGRAVPVLGGAVGAGTDAYLLNKIADQSRVEFPRRG
ncbi:EcsC family protein [Janibacter massiliensis]|uniref:EcsC family protein n=1 Tax=Janibacter massiliensis TaxID=2058291 RepID=UPI000D0FC008|nr:EcsC family protein [Janibacter massiliensis]